MAFPASITVNDIRGFGPFGKTLASSVGRLAALESLQLDQVNNTPDNLKPISRPVQDALDEIDSNVTGVTGDVSTLSDDVTTINGQITTLNGEIEALNHHAYPTSERPDPSTVPVGWMVWDATLLIPLWTDQVNWYDATGTIR